MSNKLPCILLVDDEPANLILLEELLQLNGYATISASSGSEALVMAQESRPDLILLDVMMPDMDGFEVCDRLRKDGALQTIPVIFLTALDDDNSRLKGLEMMADDYVTKPFNSRLLLAKVANMLQLGKMRSQAISSQIQASVREQTKRQVTAAWQVNEFISEKFRLFVPEQFLNRIAPQGVESIQLGNVTEEEITVLFCDIRGFTAIAESQQARETFEWLNAFFTEMSACITFHRGFIDKYLGDSIMAVFDKPTTHAKDAILAAVAMQQSLQSFNENRSTYNLQEPVNIGIGINTGIGMIGTLGSDRRMDSTVIGDVVNTASRLEGLTKIYGCPIIASEVAIAHAVGGDKLTLKLKTKLRTKNFQIPNCYHRWIDRVTPRGKQRSVNLYEIWSAQHPIAQAKLLTQPLFEKGIQAWQSRKFAVALRYFQQVTEDNPTDTIALLYIERCQERLRFNNRHDIKEL